jgi:hypothetical protein
MSITTPSSRTRALRNPFVVRDKPEHVTAAADERGHRV